MIRHVLICTTIALILFALAVRFAAGQVTVTDKFRAEQYLRDRLARLHSGHAPEFYVADQWLPHCINLLADRPAFILPGAEITIWTRLERPNVCRVKGCVARNPPAPVPLDDQLDGWASVPVRRDKIVTPWRQGTVTLPAPTNAFYFTPRAGFWPAPLQIVIPSANVLRQIYP